MNLSNTTLRKKVLSLLLVFAILFAMPVGVGAEDAYGQTTSSNPHLKYTLTKAQVDDFNAKFAQQEQSILNSSNPAIIVSVMAKIQTSVRAISQQTTIAYILYCCNLNDKKASSRYLFAQQAYSDAAGKYNDLLAKLYHSGNPVHKELFKGWPAEQLKLLTEANDKVLPLQTRNAEITTQLYALSEKEQQTKVGPLYSEFIKNSNSIAKEYGYANYYDYATDVVYQRDSTKTQREAFRAYVKKYIIPLYEDSRDTFEKLKQNMSAADLKAFAKLMTDDYDKLPAAFSKKNYLNGYFKTLPQSGKTKMSSIFKENRYIRTDSKNARVAAFTTMLDAPFCYFGPDMQSSFTIIHELGHYYAAMVTGSISSPMDLNETQSHGNELLFASYLNKELPKKYRDLLIAYRLYYFSNVIIDAALMDQFEEAVYTSSIPSSNETAYFDQLMKDTMASYGLTGDESMTASMLWRWRNDGIPNPVYFLSYAVSSVSALQIYSLGLSDYQAAVKSYCALVEDSSKYDTYSALLKHAGLSTPYEEASYKDLASLLPEVKTSSRSDAAKRNLKNQRIPHQFSDEVTRIFPSDWNAMVRSGVGGPDLIGDHTVLDLAGSQIDSDLTY